MSYSSGLLDEQWALLDPVFNAPASAEASAIGVRVKAIAAMGRAYVASAGTRPGFTLVRVSRNALNHVAPIDGPRMGKIRLHVR